MKAIGIILAGGNSKRMKDLSQYRAIAAMPVAGGYRAIDFALSSMSNSHISKVAVIAQYNSFSLNEHLSSSKWWDFGRKQGGPCRLDRCGKYHHKAARRKTARRQYRLRRSVVDA